nr:cobalamin-dependent protein [uncultured Desulfobacter sp.]
MITDKLYQIYFDLILNGKRFECTKIVQDLLNEDVEIYTLYTDLFQRSLYEIGKLWELNKISVAKEHLVTAITESLLNLAYPKLFRQGERVVEKSVVISCSANEYHQIGGKMVADVFEINGWDSHFLGADTPVDHLLAYIQDVNPDLVGLSLSVFFNMPALKNSLEAIRSNFNNMDIFVGGQAFRWGGLDTIKKYSGTEYIPTLTALERSIKLI